MANKITPLNGPVLTRIGITIDRTTGVITQGGNDIFVEAFSGNNPPLDAQLMYNIANLEFSLTITEYETPLFYSKTRNKIYMNVMNWYRNKLTNVMKSEKKTAVLLAPCEIVVSATAPEDTIASLNLPNMTSKMWIVCNICDRTTPNANLPSSGKDIRIDDPKYDVRKTTSQYSAMRHPIESIKTFNANNIKYSYATQRGGNVLSPNEFTNAGIVISDVDSGYIDKQILVGFSYDSNGVTYGHTVNGYVVDGNPVNTVQFGCGVQEIPNTFGIVSSDSLRGLPSLIKNSLHTANVRTEDDEYYDSYRRFQDAPIYEDIKDIAKTVRFNNYDDMFAYLSTKYGVRHNISLMQMVSPYLYDDNDNLVSTPSMHAYRNVFTIEASVATPFPENVHSMETCYLNAGDINNVEAYIIADPQRFLAINNDYNPNKKPTGSIGAGGAPCNILSGDIDLMSTDPSLKSYNVIIIKHSNADKLMTAGWKKIGYVSNSSQPPNTEDDVYAYSKDTVHVGDATGKAVITESTLKFSADNDMRQYSLLLDNVIDGLITTTTKRWFYNRVNTVPGYLSRIFIAQDPAPTKPEEIKLYYNSHVVHLSVNE